MGYIAQKLAATQNQSPPPVLTDFKDLWWVLKLTNIAKNWVDEFFVTASNQELYLINPKNDLFRGFSGISLDWRELRIIHQSNF